MSNLIKGFLIDPAKRKIRPVTFDNSSLDNIYKLIRAQCFDIATVSYDPRVTIFVDDNGVFFKNKFVFKHSGYAQPLCGYGLVTGTDESGETVDAPCTLDGLYEDVRFGVNQREDAAWILDK